jgi:hypothetical protein
MPGFTGNAGGRPLNAAIRQKYMHRLPGLFDDLLEMATNSPNPMVRLGAIRLALDHLLGRPAISVDTTVTKMDIRDVGELYRQALIRANQPAGGGNCKIEKSTINSDPTEIQ